MSPRLPQRRRFGTWFVLLLIAWVVFRIWQDRQAAEIPGALAPGTYDLEFVIDGDTLRLANGATIRLIGINTPEMRDPREPWAEQATRFTKDFLKGRRLDLQMDRERIDPYGRFLGYVYVDDRLLNEELLRAGLARWYGKRFNYHERFKRRFRQAQSEAQAARRGIWSGE